MHRVRDTLLALMLLTGSLLAVATPVQAQLSPELVVDDLKVHDLDTPEIGNDIRFNATIHNNGDAAASDIEVNFTIGSVNLGTAEVESLSAGDSVDVTSPETWEVEAGNFTLLVEADGSGCTIGGECTDETSDDFAFGPDLLAEELDWAPQNPVAGDDVVFTATIRNDVADVDVDQSFEVAVYVDGTPEVTATVNGILGGQEKTVDLPPWTAVSGDHDVELVVDDGDDIDERRTDNNVLGPEALDVAAAIPDLVITDLVIQPEDPQAGDEVAFQATVLNEGNGTAPESSVRFFVDGTTQTDADVSELAPGETQNVIIREWNAETGRHTIRATADINDTVDEADETNNEASMEIVVGPDIILESISWEPEEPQTGDMVTFEAELSNDGDAIETSFRVAFLLDGEPFANATVDSLGTDETVTVESRSWNATQGQHTIGVDADADDDIEEAAEDNNQDQEQVDVQAAQPDLIVPGIELDPERPAEGEDTRFDATVKNRGNEDAGTFDVRFLVDGSQVGSDQTVDGLAAGESTTVTSDVWTAEGGTHTVEVIADVEQDVPPGDQVDEANEENNNRTLQFGIGPDLLPEDVRFDSTTATPGSNMTFETVVRNDGTDRATAFTVRLELDGQTLGEVSVDGLDANETTTVEHNWTATEGDHTVDVLVDASDAVDETNEANNERSESLSIGPDQPDLVVESISWSDDPEAGDGLTFLASISNGGNATAGEMTVAFTLDDGTALGTVTVDPLEPGSSASVSSDSWTATEGEHTITVTADADDQVAESDEDNNLETETLEVAEAGQGGDDEDPPPPDSPADLVVTQITWNDAPESGDRLSFLATIRNAGSQATGTFGVTFQLDGETELGSATIQGLAGGSSASVTSSSWTATEGNHTITVTADAADVVDEGDETNNARTESLTVATPPEDDDPGPGEDDGSPDLVVGNVTLDTEDPEEDDSVTFTAVIENPGDGPAGAFNVSFQVGGEPVGDPVRVDGLDAGATLDVTSPTWTAVEGDHTLTVTVDPGNEVDEANEGNNERSQGFTVESGNFLPAPGLALLAAVLASMALLARRRGR